MQGSVEAVITAPTTQPNKRLERTRHERASLLSCVGEPLKRSVMPLLSRTMMKPKYLALIALVALIGGLAYFYWTLGRMFRPYGDRGDAYETWEATSNAFKVKITAHYETNVYMGGAYYVCETLPHGSDRWSEFKVFRVDDANPIPSKRFRFVTDQIAYIYMGDDFVVTMDAGRTWSTWKPILTLLNGDLVHWGIEEAHVEGDGTGEAKLCRYDEKANKLVDLTVRTNDYGRNWRTG